MSKTNIRGEVRIKLGGRDWTLRPAFIALQNIEQETGLSLLELVNAMRQGRAKFTHIAVIVWAGIIGSKDPKAPTLEAVGEMILDEEQGFVGYMSPCKELMIEALRTGPREATASGNAAAPTEALTP